MNTYDADYKNKMKAFNELSIKKEVLEKRKRLLMWKCHLGWWCAWTDYHIDRINQVVTHPKLLKKLVDKENKHKKEMIKPLQVEFEANK